VVPLACLIWKKPRPSITRSSGFEVLAKFPWEKMISFDEVRFKAELEACGNKGRLA